MNIEDKIAVLARYGIKIDRRELVRSLLAIVGERAETIRTAGAWTQALKSLTMEDLLSAAERTLDKYTVEAVARFKADRLEQAETKERTGKYSWVSIHDGKECPSCNERHTMAPKTMAQWRAYGLPNTGATYCNRFRRACRCELVVAE